MMERIEALNGISYFEWCQLKLVVDEEFRRQQHESERNLRLVDVKSVKESIHSQFGCK